MPASDFDSDDVVPFIIPPSQMARGEFAPHGLGDLKDKLFGRKIEDVEGDWKRITGQINRLIASTEDSKPAGFGLDSVTVSLGFSASGKLAFIAEAGVEASVEVSFSRGGS